MYEIYRQAKAFGQRPSEVAFFGDSVGPLFLRYFDRGTWTFGELVDNSISKAASSRDPALAAVQRQWEWDRLMDDDDSSASVFADPSESTSARVRVVGRPDDRDDDGDEIILEG